MRLRRLASTPPPDGRFLGGDIPPGDQYELQQAQSFNESGVLIGTSSDERAPFLNLIGVMAARSPPNLGQFHAIVPYDETLRDKTKTRSKD